MNCDKHTGWETNGRCGHCDSDLSGKYLELQKETARLLKRLADRDFHFEHCDQFSRKCLCCGCQCGFQYLNDLCPDADDD